MPSISDVIIRLIAQDKTGAAFKTATANMKSLTKGINDVVQGLTGLNLTQLGVAGSIVLLGNKFRKIVNETAAYGKQVRELSGNLGISTEETSRLIQVADDYLIEVGQLETALEMALKNGFAPSVESLAKLADQYVAIQDPTARAAAMTEIFGRNWSALTPLLREGGDAVRANAAAISDSLVLTQQEVDKVRQLEIAQDNLGDAWAALTTELGMAVIPTLTEFINKMNEVLFLHQRMQMELGNLNSTTLVTASTYAEYVQIMTDAAQANGYWVTSAGVLMNGQTQVINTTYIMSEATWEASRAETDLAGRLMAVGGTANTASFGMYNMAQATSAAAAAAAAYAQSIAYVKAALSGAYDEALWDLAGGPPDYQFYLPPPPKLNFGGGVGGGGISPADLAAREEKNRLLEEEARIREEINRQQSELNTLMSGQLGMEEEAYALRVKESQEAIADLETQKAKLAAQIASYESLSNPNARLRSELQAVKDEYAAINEQIEAQKNNIAETAEEHAKATQSILFDLIQQRLELDGLTAKESDFLAQLATQTGMVDQATRDAWAIFGQLGDQFNDPNKSMSDLLAAFIGAMNKLNPTGGTNNYAFNYTGPVTKQQFEQSFQQQKLLG